MGPGNAFTMHRPRELGMGGVLHPIITWGNGGGGNPSGYTALLAHLGSHGFIVIASNNPMVNSGVEMLEGVDFVLAENERDGSPLFGHVDVAFIAALGHSAGGAGSCAAALDNRLTTFLPVSGGRSCEQQPPKVPGLWLTGSRDTLAVPDQIEAVYASVSGPAMFGVLAGADHFTPTGDGGGFRRPITAWMRFHLMADASAGKLFNGDDCGLCSDPQWVFKRRNQ